MFNPRLSSPSRPIAVALLLAAVGLPLVGTGCSGPQPVRHEPVAARNLVQEADAALARAVEEVRRGRLQSAAEHTAEAQDLAQNPTQKRQAQSLDQLIAGARAMLKGDARAAGKAWARITDPGLKQEVHLLADRIGIDVPVVVASSKES